ncbi:MAG: hypothetical protein VXZ40_04105 [Nanoarchaeota archaeon]|nr:hypothetical protein [Nanoarchaeota archaeon]
MNRKLTTLLFPILLTGCLEHDPIYSITAESKIMIKGKCYREILIDRDNDGFFDQYIKTESKSCEIFRKEDTKVINMYTGGKSFAFTSFEAKVVLQKEIPQSFQIDYKKIIEKESKSFQYPNQSNSFIK